MYAIKIHHLILCAALIALCVPVAMAQSDDTATAQKRAAIRELMEVTGMQRYTVATFQNSVTLYQHNWADSVVADFKAKGLFNKLTPEDAARMEQLIRQFGDRIFNEAKRRVVQEVATTDNLSAIAEPTFDKHLSLDEIRQLLAFCKSPVGRKLTDEYYKIMSETVAAYLQSNGAFDVKPSPEAEMAKLEQLKKDVQNLSAGGIRQLLASAKIPPEYFTQAEREELIAFHQTPLGRKLVAEAPQMVMEIMADNAKLSGTRIERISKEVIGEQMAWFEQQTREVLKNYDAQGRRKPALAQ